MGRPRKQILKSEVVRVRFTSMEKRVLKGFAEKAGISISELIRNKVIGIKLIQKLTADEVKMLRVLINMSTNLNEIAKKVNQGRVDTEALNDAFNNINNIIKSFK